MLLQGHPSAIEKNLFITDEHRCGKWIKADDTLLNLT